MESKKELMTIQEVKQMACDAVNSRLFQIPTKEAAFTLMMLCQSEGIHPIQALKRYHIIKGRPSMRADAMLAEFQRLGGRVDWKERTDKKVTATFFHDQGGKVEIIWTIEMAQKAKLTANDTWSKYPRQMLTARVISEGVRTIFPGVVTGIYTPEEIQDFTELKPNDASPKNRAESATKRPKPEDKQESAEDAVIIADIDNAKKASEVADELKLIRNLAQKAGCKSQDEMKSLINGLIGREAKSSHDMADKERKLVIEELTKELDENEKGGNNEQENSDS